LYIITETDANTGKPVKVDW